MRMDPAPACMATHFIRIYNTLKPICPCANHAFVLDYHGRRATIADHFIFQSITGSRRSRSMAPLARRRWCPRQGFLQGWFRAADEQEGGFVDSFSQVRHVHLVLSSKLVVRRLPPSMSRLSPIHTIHLLLASIHPQDTHPAHTGHASIHNLLPTSCNLI